MTVPASKGLIRTFNDQAEFVDFVIKRKPITLAADTTLLAAQSGSTILVSAADMDITLPAIGADQVGMYFKFLFRTIATDQKIIAQTGDILDGGVIIMSTGAGVENDCFAADNTDDLTFAMNGTTKGGVQAGSVVEYHAISTTRWFVSGFLHGSGTLVTPFS